VPPGPLSDPASDELALRRFKQLLGGVIAAWFLLIYTHGGEFWPFSKFPMFARSGRPWSTALVRELSADELAQPLLEVEEQALPGQPFALGRQHINQDDLTSVIRPMLKGVTPEHTELLARYFQKQRATRHLVLYVVRGAKAPKKTIQIRFQPLAIIGPDGVRAVPATTP